MVNSRKGKLRTNNQRCSQIKVVTHWQHTEEVSPSFKKLMMILLKPGSSQQAETAKKDKERQNEQC